MLVRSDTLRDQAFNLIRKKIFNGELAFGQHLSIATLSREFGISNSPIREAVALLVTEGLVESVPNQGFKVLDLNEEIFSQLANAICVLLCGCYDSLVLEGKSGELIKRLSECLNAQREYKTPDASYDYACLSIDFDRSFVTLCGNPMLIRMFDSKFSLLVLCTMQVYAERKENIIENLMQHTAIYGAAAAGQHEYVHHLLNLHYDKHKPAAPSGS